ncbi:hypothetical protein HCB37_05045 [Listeria booriae]|uniref:abortive infection system antitoxin AbiGi family protein n=1 Tax=Listeria booriae TaxID=1552123 RepID=UPI0016278815|nr:abortive infection system antitoxin AbiGi family protein [Listeria booriae]MBC1973739.1 hypothetical protein [Listeria booriae]MBC2031447.1 hypothetical protein [Listeria booriae]MBC2263881.1 hypothetical protein [Listeria booriae]
MDNQLVLNAGNQKKYHHYKQSANSLFNFMSQRQFLIEAIQKMSLFPRYFEENVEYLEIYYGEEQIRRVLFPMLCFCDINLHRLPFHVEGDGEHDFGYGKYGIGLDKRWCQENGLQPISYLNSNSTSTKLLKNAVNKSLDLHLNNHEIDSKFETYLDFTITQLAFSKPLMGMMKRSSCDVYKNFHDEKEWRYLPDLDQTDMPTFKNDVMDQQFHNSIATSQLSDTLKTMDNVPLSLEIDAINYIFIDTLEDRKLILEVLKERFETDKAMEMASKIVVYDQIVRDW